MEVEVDPSISNVAELRNTIDNLATHMHGHGIFSPLLMCALAQAYLSIGETAKTLETVATGLELVEASEERWFETELHRVRGIALASAGASHENVEAESSMRKAIDLAKSSSARLHSSH